MHNELIWLVEIILNFLLIIAAYKLFGKWGLIMWIPVSIIIANIQVVQTIELFGFSATLGNVVYATSFLVTDILSENYGKKEAGKAVWIGFFSLLAMTVLMNIALLYRPLADDAFSAETYSALDTIFSLMPRIALASVVAYVVSQRHDVWAFHFWKNRFPADRHLWVRSNFSTMVSQLFDSAIFVLIAFWGVFEKSILLEIFLTTYFFKWLVALADTPFVYWARKISRNGKFVT
ncbi:MAG: queuosine precursor transporter [Prolixibacteraceae bacterium]|nr:queuosine precursor transporter [Prolixibacteraceae bacterium]